MRTLEFENEATLEVIKLLKDSVSVSSVKQIRLLLDYRNHVLEEAALQIMKDADVNGNRKTFDLAYDIRQLKQ